MASKQQHLIERAAARLAETQVTAFQPPRPRPSPEPRRAMPLDLPIDLQPPRVVVDDEALGETAARVAAQPASAPGVTEERQIEPARLAKAGLIRDPDSRVSEEFRIVQNRVLRQSFGDASAISSGVKNIVMITSALKGEGKSFVSLNLAGEIARQGDRRVLLIDVDPKPNSLSRILGVASARGLLDLTRDVRLDVTEIIIPTAAEGLDIAPLGKIDGRRGEVLASRRMGQIMEEIGRRPAAWGSGGWGLDHYALHGWAGNLYRQCPFNADKPSLRSRYWFVSRCLHYRRKCPVQRHTELFTDNPTVCLNTESEFYRP